MRYIAMFVAIKEVFCAITGDTEFLFGMATAFAIRLGFSCLAWLLKQTTACEHFRISMFLLSLTLFQNSAFGST